MKRLHLTAAVVIASLLSIQVESAAQVPGRGQVPGQGRGAQTGQAPQTGQAMPGGQPSAAANGAGSPAARVATSGKPTGLPFPKPTVQAETEMERVLIAWQGQSEQTKFLTLGFTKWSYNLSGAPNAQIPAIKSSGVLKYAAPDKGLYEVTEKLFFDGFDANQQPKYSPKTNQLGEKWVCTGKNLVAYDKTAKKCTIFPIPDHLQGKGIINSPLPFVFNLNAADVRRRFWVRLVAPPREDLILVEAWPKTQKDRAEYKMVQIALTKDTYLPAGLIVYPPNFNVVGSPNRDIYEFQNVKRNQMFAGLKNFMNLFVPEKPPMGWKVEEDKSLMGQAAIEAANR